MGVLKSRQGAGTFVADGPPIDSPADAPVETMQMSFAPVADVYISALTPNQNKAGDAFVAFALP